MATKEKLLEELNWVTEKISAQIWALNLGTLGTTWSLLITTPLPNNVRFTARDALPVVVLCIVSLICELGQYLSAYFMQRQILTTMEKNGLTEFQYDPKSALRRSRMFFFWCKILAVIIAAGFLVFTLFRKFA
jgi:hypothetical protein